MGLWGDRLFDFTRFEFNANALSLIIGFQFSEDFVLVPLSTIVSNAGASAPLIVGKLLEQDDPNLGYDATKGEYVDMIKAGIVDPLKVVRTALVDAASVSLLLTTSEALVVEHAEQKTAQRVPDLDQMDL